jgi:hypothetical protein
MATILNQEREKVISPTLGDKISSTEEGVYYIQQKWVLDENTNLPVGTIVEVSFPS